MGHGVDQAPFIGSSEMAERCRAVDWSQTSLGPVSGWPRSLQTLVATLLASRHPMFLWWGPDLIQFYNDGYRPSLGASGRHPAALGAKGRECWTDIWNVIGPEIDGVLTTGEATWHQDQLIPIERNGRLEPVWWTYSYSPVRDDDWSIAGVLVIVEETAERVQALQTLTDVFAQAPVAIAVFEGDTFIFTVANDGYRRLIGDRDPVGKRLVEMFPDLDGSEIERVMRTVYRTSVPFVANDFLVRFDSQGTGSIDNYYDFVYQPLVDEDGVVPGVVAIAVDVTERHRHGRERDQLLAEAQAARAEAETANRSKSEFLAVMSHELRTPLNAIGGGAGLIERGVRGPVTPEQRTDLQRIQQSQRHLLGLINGVLNYTRVEAGAVPYHVIDVPVREILAACEALTAPQVLARHLALTIDTTAGAVHARADMEKVQQIVLNLLTNAIKFTEPGGAITLGYSAHGDCVDISVRDTGSGIAPHQLQRVFEPFVQVDATLTRRNKGVGLGLAISRDLARGMGGDLMIESTLGQGSTFMLRLPLATSVARGS